jgi:hypothetical protein
VLKLLYPVELYRVASCLEVFVSFVKFPSLDESSAPNLDCLALLIYFIS